MTFKMNKAITKLALSASVAFNSFTAIPSVLSLQKLQHNAAQCFAVLVKQKALFE